MPTALTIDKSKVSSAYSGKNGKCACGCSGTYWYASAHREAAGKNRGYAVGDEEVNDKQITRVVNKILAIAEGGENVDKCNEYCSAVEGGRVYTVYFKG